jgi:hypothetical protein
LLPAVPSFGLGAPLRVAFRRVYSFHAMNQVSILVNGFNLYPSLVDAEWKLKQYVKCKETPLRHAIRRSIFMQIDAYSQLAGTDDEQTPEREKHD